MPTPILDPVLTFTGDLPNFLTQPPMTFAANANNSVLQWNAILQSYNASLVDFNAALLYVDGQVTLAEHQVTLAGNQVLLAADQVQLAADQVSYATIQAGYAETAKNIAFGLANIVGNWSDQTGAFPAFSAVFNNDKIWVAKVDIPDITLNQPTVANATWIDYYDEISAGTVVSGPSDVNATRIANVGWLQSRGFGAHPSITGSFIRAWPAGVSHFWANAMSDGPEPNAYGFATVTQNPVNDGYRINFQYYTSGARYVLWMRSGVSSGWLPDDVPAVVPVTRGGTGSETAAGALSNLGAAKAGIVTGSGITMFDGNMLGRPSGGTGTPEHMTPTAVLNFANAAKRGAIGSSLLTMSTARMLGRTAVGTGAPQEMTGTDVQAFVGISAGSGSLSGDAAFITDISYSFTKIGSLVTIAVKFYAKSGLLSTSSYGKASPGWGAGFPLPAQSGGGVATCQLNPAKTLIKMSLNSSGALYFAPNDTTSGDFTYTGSFSYTV